MIVFYFSIFITILIGLLSLMRHGEKDVSPYEKSFVSVTLLAFLLSVIFTTMQHPEAGKFAYLYIFWLQLTMIFSVFLGLVFIYFVHNVIWIRRTEKLFWSMLFVFSGMVFLKFFFLLRERPENIFLKTDTFLPLQAIPYFIFYTGLFLVLLIRLYSFSKRVQSLRRKAFITNVLLSIVLLLTYFSVLMLARKDQIFLVHSMFLIWFGHLVLFEMRYLKDEIIWDAHILLQNLCLFTFVFLLLAGIDLLIQMLMRSPVVFARLFLRNLALTPVIFFSVLAFQSIVNACDKNLFSSLYFFKERCKMTGSHARSVFDMFSFQKMTEFLFEDFPGFQNVFILSFLADGTLKVIDGEKEDFAPVSERDRTVIDKIFSGDTISGEELAKHVHESKASYLNLLFKEDRNRAFFPLVIKAERKVALILETDRPLTRKQIKTILEEKTNLFLALNNVFVFEKEREKALANILEKEELERLSYLQEQNIKLNKAYKEIKNVQEELISKERKASIVQITLSLDSEISNPLTNILVPLQYLLSKLKEEDGCDEERVSSILEIMESESKKIKSILEQLRSLIEKWSKKALLDDTIMKGIETDFDRIVKDGEKEE